MQRNLRFINPDGKRQDAATTYLHPKLQGSTFPNLHVVLNNKVLRVLIQGGRAVGIEVETSTAQSGDLTDNKRSRHIKARKMVIVSCGALGTPLVLERSGVGNSKILEKYNIPVAADLPGVGQQYQDHQLMVYSYRSSLNPEETLDALAGGRVDPGLLIQNNDPILGWNGQDVTSKIRPTDKQVATFGERFQEVWKRNYEPYSDRPLVQLTLIPV